MQRRSVASCAATPNLDGYQQFHFEIFRTFHSPTLLLAWKLVSVHIVDAVKAGAEMAEHFAPGRLRCCCEFINADALTNKRNHLAEAPNRRIRKIGDIDRQQIHRRTPSDRTPATTDN